MASFLALGFTLIVGWLIIQRYKSQAVLLLGGFGMMVAAYFLDVKTDFVPVKNTTNFWLFDMFHT